MREITFTNRWWLLLLLAAMCSLSLVAQEVKPRPASDFLDLQHGVTEDELVTRTLASNPTLAAQRQQIEIAKGDVTQAHLRKNPSLNLGGLKEVNGGDNSISVSGMLPLELYGRLRAALKLRRTRKTSQSNLSQIRNGCSQAKCELASVKCLQQSVI